MFWIEKLAKIALFQRIFVLTFLPFFPTAELATEAEEDASGMKFVKLNLRC